MRRTDRQRAKFAAVVNTMRASFAGVSEDEIIIDTRKAVIEVRDHLTS